MSIQFDYPVPTVTITPYSLESMGALLGTTAPNSATWTSANRAMLIPFRLYKPAKASKIFWMNGVTVAGNVDAGIYDVVGTRLASIGSTAAAGASALQEVAFSSPVLLGAGFFYMALAITTNTATVFRRTIPNDYSKLHSVGQMTPAFPLPANITFESVSSSTYIPFMGVRFSP